MINRYKLIIEGCDCSGKSTLMKKLIDYISSDTFTAHFTKVPKGMDRQIWTQFNFEPVIDCIMNTIVNNVILDRAYISEAVYRTVYASTYPAYNFEHIDLVAKSNNYIHIYCKADAETILKRLKERKDWYVEPNIEDIKDILSWYEYYLAQTNTKVIIYNSDKDQDGQEFNKLIREIESL